MIFAQEDRLDQVELATLQPQRLKRIFGHAYENVPFHHDLRDAAGVVPEDVHSLTDLGRLPRTRKQRLRDNSPFGLCAVPMRAGVRIRASSGTRGLQTVVGQTRGDIGVRDNTLRQAMHPKDFGAQGVSCTPAAFSTSRTRATRPGSTSGISAIAMPPSGSSRGRRRCEGGTSRPTTPSRSWTADTQSRSRTGRRANPS